MHQQPVIRSGRAGASFHAAANRPRDCHCGGIRRFVRQLDPDRRGETSTVTILSSRTSPMGRGRSPISTGHTRASKARLDCCWEVECLSGLHFSPRGEAKCVRGPSGRGASRAEEKGASRLARAGVLAQSPPSPFGLANHGFSNSPAVMTFLLERTRPPPMVFTNHETRITAFPRVLRPSGGEQCRLVPPAGVLTGSCSLARSRAPGF